VAMFCVPPVGVEPTLSEV